MWRRPPRATIKVARSLAVAQQPRVPALLRASAAAVPPQHGTKAVALAQRPTMAMLWPCARTAAALKISAASRPHAVRPAAPRLAPAARPSAAVRTWRSSPATVLARAAARSTLRGEVVSLASAPVALKRVAGPDAAAAAAVRLVLSLALGGVGLSVARSIAAGVHARTAVPTRKAQRVRRLRRPRCQPTPSTDAVIAASIRGSRVPGRRVPYVRPSRRYQRPSGCDEGRRAGGSFGVQGSGVLSPGSTFQGPASGQGSASHC